MGSYRLTNARAVNGRGSGSAGLRRPQFRQANAVIQSPESISTARSSMIIPLHLSQTFIPAL